MVGQSERQLEGTLGDALVQVSDVLGAGITFAASDGQYAALDLQFKVVFLEARRRDYDAVLVVGIFLDVVGWIAATRLVTHGRLEQVIETVETNGLTEQRGHGKCGTHDVNLLKFSEWLIARPDFGIPHD